MKIAISAESTIDIDKTLLKKFDIKTLPFTITMGEQTKKDGEVDIQEIFDFVAKTKILPKTSAVNEVQYEEHFNNLLQEYDGVVHISLSSELSCAYENAFRVAKNYKNVYVIDSRSLSTGIALLCIYARKLAEAGEDPQVITEKVKERIPYVQVSFILNKLDYLYKGGRCSSLQLFGANILNLKPQIVVKNGKMKSAKKYRGKFEKVVPEYVRDTLEEFDNPDKENIFITSTTASDELIERVKAVLEERGFKNIFITHANCTIASHCGDNCMGILYINDGD